MIHSMTGFGEAQLEEDGHVYQLELRSVNNRYFKSAVHIPDEFAFLEPEIERRLRQSVSRGSVTLRLHIRDLSAAAALEINVAAVAAYVEQLRRAVQPGTGATTIDLAMLATLPGVCQPRPLSESYREQAVGIIERLMDQALQRLVEMRAVEGRALAADLRGHCERIAGVVESIRGRSGRVVDEFRKRLLARVQELIADSNVRLAEEDLLREVAVYAERSDIHEELARLSAHLDQFRGLFESPEPAGRKMDFIAQEMLREANTVGSKAGDAQIAREIIEVKALIDRIKEQVQNVE